MCQTFYSLGHTHSHSNGLFFSRVRNHELLSRLVYFQEINSLSAQDNICGLYKSIQYFSIGLIGKQI